MEIFAHPQPHKTKTLLTSCGLPIADLDIKKFENFLYMGTFDNPVGIIGLEIFDSVALLRSLAVSEEARGKGYAKLLVCSIESLARSKNIKEIYLLTETAEAFLKKLDYCVIQRELAPESIKNTSEYSGVCPKSAVLMNKQLIG